MQSHIPGGCSSVDEDLNGWLWEESVGHCSVRSDRIEF